MGMQLAGGDGGALGGEQHALAARRGTGVEQLSARVDGRADGDGADRLKGILAAVIPLVAAEGGERPHEREGGALAPLFGAVGALGLRVAEAHEGARGAGAQDLFRLAAVLLGDAADGEVRPRTADGEPFFPRGQLYFVRIEGAQKGVDEARRAPLAHLFDEGDGVVGDHVARLIQKQQHIQRYFEQDAHGQLGVFGREGADAEVEVAVVFEHAVAQLDGAGALGRLDGGIRERLFEVGAAPVHLVQDGVGVVEGVGHRPSPNRSPTATLRPLTASAARSIFPPANCSSVTRSAPSPAAM